MNRPEETTVGHSLGMALTVGGIASWEFGPKVPQKDPGRYVGMEVVLIKPE